MRHLTPVEALDIITSFSTEMWPERHRPHPLPENYLTTRYSQLAAIDPEFGKLLEVIINFGQASIDEYNISEDVMKEASKVLSAYDTILAGAFASRDQLMEHAATTLHEVVSERLTPRRLVGARNYVAQSPSYGMTQLTQEKAKFILEKFQDGDWHARSPDAVAEEVEDDVLHPSEVGQMHGDAYIRLLGKNQSLSRLVMSIARCASTSNRPSKDEMEGTHLPLLRRYASIILDAKHAINDHGAPDEFIRSAAFALDDIIKQAWKEEEIGAISACGTPRAK